MAAAKRKEPGTGKGRKAGKEPQRSPGEEVTSEVLEFISAIENYKKPGKRDSIQGSPCKRPGSRFHRNVHDRLIGRRH